jgi:tetratricopeptide (TPR) repeat protein
VRDRHVFLLLLAIAFGLYANSFAGDYVFDDLSTFRRARIQDQGFFDLADDYRPLRYLSLRVDEAIFGNRTWGHHVTNTILHGVAAFVVFATLRRLAGPAAALAGALIFVTHPVHTECVAYISGRRDVLTTIFYLLGFLAWLEFNRTSRRRWPAAGLGAYALAYGAKEMAITLPAACVLYDLLLDPERARPRLRLYVAMGIVAAALAVHVLFFSGATRQQEWHGGSMASNFATSSRLLVHYAMLLVFPLRLLGDYSYYAFPLSRSFLEGRVLLSLAAIALGVGAAVYARRRAPLVAFGLGWFLVTLLPVLQIKTFHELAAEHYLYLPSVGFCLLAGLGFVRLKAVAGTPVAWIALGTILALFSVRTVLRNPDWRDSETFWRTTAEAAPDCARAHFNVGMVHAQRAEWKLAAACIERAIAIRPDYLNARRQLGRVYGFLGRVGDARAQWEQALAFAKRAKSPAIGPADFCIMLDRHDEAIELLEDNLANDLRVEKSLERLVLCHKVLGTKAGKALRREEGLSHYRSALRAAEKLLLLRPEDKKLLLEAAELAKAIGDRIRSDELSRRAARLPDPNRR